ncbi:MAG: Calx-beta domain-containing protein, partial [Cyanobacteriota bacterium]
MLSPTAPAMPQNLPEPILRDWRQLLSQWSHSGALSRAVREALRLPGEPDQLRRLLERWSAGEFGELPVVEVVPASALPAAAGAYASRTGTIYLNQAWLERASHPQVWAVLTEELGHHLDGLLNGGDTPGDEGELLAALLHGGGPISEERRQELLAEDDRGSLRLGEQEWPVEQAARVVSTPNAVTIPWRTAGEDRNRYAFAALKADGSVVTSGTSWQGGDSGAVAGQLTNIVAFANPFTDDRLLFEDPQPVITLSVSPTTGVREDSADTLRFTVSRTGDPSLPLTVAYTVGGTARLGTDYTGIAATPASKAVTFAAGASSATISVTPRADKVIEPDETVSLTLAAGSGYTVGTGGAVVGTIQNDDFPVVTLALSPEEVDEDGAANLVYTFTRSGPVTSALWVKYTVSGSAILNGDYTGISAYGSTKSLLFAKGSATATVTVDPKEDTTIEADETVALTLATGTGYTIATPTAVTGRIRNDDRPAITLAISPGAVTEDGTTNLVYTFTRTGPTSAPLKVNYALAGSATVGVDYTGISPAGASKAVGFAKGARTTSVTVNPTVDSACEADESVTLTLEAGPGYSVGTTTAVTGWIRNDDLPRVTLTLSPTAVRENDSGVLTYTFTRTGPTSEALNVQVALGGTATPGVDYTGIAYTGDTTTVAFAAGAATATVTVDPAADTSIEPDETVALTLAAGSGYTIGTPAAVVGTIRNDDSSLTLYDPTVPTRPGQQGWLAVNTGLLGRESGSANGTILDTSLFPLDLAGYSNRVATSQAPLVNGAFPSLDRTVGFRLDFRLHLLNDVNASPNRAGFSVTLLDQSPIPLGIELGFQRDPASGPAVQGRIFSQEGGATPFQEIGERSDSLSFSSAETYSLRFLEQSYVLLAGNTVVLSGALRDYSQAPSDPRIPFNPYRLPNVLF